MSEDFPLFEQRLFLGDSASYMYDHFHKLALAAVKQAADNKWYIGDSDIQGSGVFAAEDIPEGTEIGLCILGEEQDEDGDKFRNLTTLSRYCNHLPMERASTEIVKKDDGRLYMVACRDISEDEELTADYADVTNKIGFGVGMRYGDEIMPTVDLATFKQEPSSDEDSRDRAGDK